MGRPREAGWSSDILYISTPSIPYTRARLAVSTGNLVTVLHCCSICRGIRTETIAFLFKKIYKFVFHLKGYRIMSFHILFENGRCYMWRHLAQCSRPARETRACPRGTSHSPRGRGHRNAEALGGALPRRLLVFRKSTAGSPVQPGLYP